MREVRKSALLPYSAGQMYALVADVRRYPEFLPWCTAARVLEEDGEFMTVALDLQRGLVRTTFTTRNRLVPDRTVEMRLVDGPFTALEGRWDFAPIADAGTRADLLVRFETRGLFDGLTLGPAFERICSQLVDAFARRARQLHAHVG